MIRSPSCGAGSALGLARHARLAGAVEVDRAGEVQLVSAVQQPDAQEDGAGQSHGVGVPHVQADRSITQASTTPAPVRKTTVMRKAVSCGLPIRAHDPVGVG